MVATPLPCISYPIFLWNRGSTTWHEYGSRTDSTGIDKSDKPCFHTWVAEEVEASDVAIILATADSVREHEACRISLSDEFQIPQLWWTLYCRNSNGYFGCETQTDEDGNLTGMTSWVHFKVKVFKEDTVYYWYNINMFVNWDGSSGKTVAFIFDPPDDLKPKIPGIILQNLKSQTLMDPFWIYPCVQENIVAIQDREVWGIRTQIRGAELARDQVAYRSLDGKPKPNYARLHDLARHAIHGIETLEVAVKTSQSMIHQHSSFREAFDASPTNQKVAFRAAYHHIQERLLFFEHMLDSLRHRSSSNKQRLLNEVQLAFNSVSQYDAGLSLQISHATRADSSAMRTIAFLTLTFLPATFIAAVFSMSFFSYDHDTGWKMASEFWLYWVIAMPVTVVTAGSWMWWQRYQAEGAKRELFVDTQDVYSRQYSWT